VAGLARALLGDQSPVPWEALGSDYDLVRERIARVVPGFENMNERVRQPGGFVLPSGARTRAFETETGLAHFTVLPLPRLELRADEYLMMTVRSHDQYNTTVYGLDDRYRGVRGDRRVVLIHPDDLAKDGLAAGQRVDLVSEFAGETRRVRGFRLVAYETPRGCVVTYFPETNALVPLGSRSEKSLTPSYKSTPVRLEPTSTSP